MMMADRIGVMHDGRLLQVGTPEEVYNRPRSAFVANFLGETNLLPARITGQAGNFPEVTFADGTTGRCSRGASGSAPSASARQMLVSVRPEKIELHRARDESHNFENVVDGTVISSSFVGPYVHYKVRALDTELSVKHVGAAHTFRNGDAVTATWKSADAQLLPDNSQTR